MRDSADTLTNCPICGADALSDVESCPACSINLTDFRRIVESARSELDRARSLLARGEYDDAKSACERAVELYDGVEHDALAIRIKSALHRAELDEATGLIETLPDGEERSGFQIELDALEATLSAARERFNTALSSARRGNLQEAAENLKSAILSDPKMIPAYRLLGKVYTELGESENARSIIERGLRRYPSETSLSKLRMSLSELDSAGVRGVERKSSAFERGRLLQIIQTVLLGVILIVLLLILLR